MQYYAFFWNFANEQNLTIQLVQDWRAALAAKGVKPLTILGYNAAMAALVNDCIEHGTLTENPFKKRPRYRYEITRNKAFAPELAERLYNALKSYDERLYITATVMRVGLIRPGELVQLQVQHFHNDRLLVPAEIAKSRKNGVVYLDENAAELLKHYLKDKPANAFIIPHIATSIGCMHRQFIKAQGLAGKGYTLYSWKHTGACELYRRTRDIKLIQRVARHSSIQITDTYLRSLNVELENDNPLLLRAAV